MQTKVLKIVTRFIKTDQLLIRYAAFVKTVLQKKWKHKGAVHQIFIDFKEVGKEILYYVFKVYGIPMDLGRLIQIC